MSAPLRFLFRKQTLWLSAARCVFWEEEKVLIVSDLHLGKSGHFRKSGIGIPQNIYKKDLQTLFSQIQFFHPEKILIAGDMFHSTANKELNFFSKWRKDFSQIEFLLIKGNHDILPKRFYNETLIKVIENKLSLGKFCFTHDITSFCEDDDRLFTFSGHIHPGIKMQGIASQSLMLPCFYFSKKYAVLPAFSAFTGLTKIPPAPTDAVFALVENDVIRIQ